VFRRVPYIFLTDQDPLIFPILVTDPDRGGQLITDGLDPDS
jgi:hypothetical protein